MFTTNPERQIEIELLAKALHDLPIRETASYEALSSIAGYSVQARPFALIKARKKVEAETGLRFETVNRIGVKKLDGASVPGIGARARKTIARKAKRQAERLCGLKYNDIDKDTQARIDAERSLLGAISATAKADAQKVTEHTQTGPVVAARLFELLHK